MMKLKTTKSFTKWQMIKIINLTNEDQIEEYNIW
jgi:hypothetical protein